MKVSKSGYYKWKYRQENPSDKERARKSDIELIITSGPLRCSIPTSSAIGCSAILYP